MCFYCDLNGNFHLRHLKLRLLKVSDYVFYSSASSSCSFIATHPILDRHLSVVFPAVQSPLLKETQSLWGSSLRLLLIFPA
jgi:hypothetical protein